MKIRIISLIVIGVILGISLTSPLFVSDALTFTDTVTTYVPPSVLSLHFWWYPFFTLLIYDGLFFSVALALGVPQEDLIFMALLGFVEAGWICYFMQTLGIQEVVLFTAGFALYEWRALA